MTTPIQSIYSKQQLLLNNERPFALDKRLSALKTLNEMITKYEQNILQALKKDLGKNPAEAWLAEFGYLRSEITYTIKHLHKWIKPKKVKTSLMQFPGRSHIMYEPLGQTLVIAPWNYPIQLAIAPVIASVAAGNVTMLKPSEISGYSSKLLYTMFSEFFNEDYIAVIEGGVEETNELLDLPWDHIFFTGSTAVGRIIAKKSAEHLSRVTLELGGKTPTVVTKHANIEIAAKRIVWGKFMNAGQTCIAPDYILADESIKEQLIEQLKQAIVKFYGEQPEKSGEYSRIINQKHFNRIIKLIDSNKVVFGGTYSEADLYIAPTILHNVTIDCPVMHDEIFAPLLPIITYSSLKEVPMIINKNKDPLAAYYFSENKDEIEFLLQKIPAGGVSINTTIQHIVEKDLPFGGRGSSGQGSYHGYASFKQFSHEKSVIYMPTLFDLTLKYPPLTSNLKWLKKFF